MHSQIRNVYSTCHIFLERTLALNKNFTIHKDSLEEEQQQPFERAFDLNLFRAVFLRTRINELSMQAFRRYYTYGHTENLQTTATGANEI